jgi:lysophospholipase L1-like esterase
MPQTYASVYPSGVERPQAADLIVPFNNELRRLTAGMQNVHVVDLYTAFGTNRSLMGADGLHPTEAGYELMAQTFVQAIEKVFQVRGSLQ